MAADWPQWMGPKRDGTSTETGLLRAWPSGGPKLVFKKELGGGFSGISVVAGVAYTMYSTDDREYVVALDAKTGAQKWRKGLDSEYSDSMGGPGPRSTPTIVDAASVIKTIATVSRQRRPRITPVPRRNDSPDRKRSRHTSANDDPARSCAAGS